MVNQKIESSIEIYTRNKKTTYQLKMSKTKAYINFIRTLPDSHPLVQDHRNMMRCGGLKSSNDTQHYSESETEKVISSKVIDQIMKKYTNEKSDDIEIDSCDSKDSKDSNERNSEKYHAESKNNIGYDHLNECLPDHTDIVPQLDLSMVVPHSLSDSILNRASDSKTSLHTSLTEIEKSQNVYDTFSPSVNEEKYDSK